MFPCEFCIFLTVWAVVCEVFCKGEQFLMRGFHIASSDSIPSFESVYSVPKL